MSIPHAGSFVKDSNFRVWGTNNKGERVFWHEFSDRPYSLDEIKDKIGELHEKHPTAICFEMQLTFSDKKHLASLN